LLYFDPINYRKYQSKRLWLHFLTIPFIWLPLVFVLVLDLVCEIYQLVCFPIYRIDYVKRSKYILILDRNKLEYLNGIEKLCCMYCGYANGVFLYLKEVAGLTEKYWCGVMHEEKAGFKIQEDQVRQNFAVFGDEKDCEKKYGKIM
jgi:hypothetical protein